MVCFLKPNQLHPSNIVAVVVEKDVDSFEEKKIVVCFLKPNQLHPSNIVAVVVEKDVDSFEEKNRGLFPEIESTVSIEYRSCCRRKRR